MPTIPSILSSLDIASLNAMQETASATIAEKNEVLLLAPTGSGKTLAFLLPISQLLKENGKQVQCLVLTPSRELAIQIEQVWKKMATGFKVSCCYGGHDMQTEIQNLAEPPALLIGTPGRIADHIKRATFSREAVRTLVLDEFDKSLALGFEEDMSYIFRSLEKLDKKIFVSATATVDIPAFAEVSDELTVLNNMDETKKEAALTLQLVVSEEKDKVDRLVDLLAYINSEPAIVFFNHRDAVERASTLLREKGIECGAFHGGMEQMQREQALIQFRNGSNRFLLATDLAARGLDIPEMKHVIHYHLPSTEAEFTHRNGRTARMEETGTAYLLVHTEEQLPGYIRQKPGELEVPHHAKLPKPAEWVTVYINGGKKDKLNKVDIVGFLSQKGRLEKHEIGLIIVNDRNAFVAVKKHKIKTLLPLVQNEKIKGTKYKIVVAR
ncbi:DEAD/DEAH box helicase [Sediminibacterium roseum]|uniref:DEAD/DEAH box helicase n=1 Tax=Sediminibacterium roseum TaxID=1978412 RepID=A0ABW9ZWM4_9BACT|nr:DEAD/DEAH box helicase [Sediminibacterium roseum]NCI50752.1 DEAD/DEAH box helicase [Sediminibacterium roseum]